MKKLYAFTLAESLITLSLIGVVAAITIPSIVKQHTMSVNRTKLKKAVEVYSNAVISMISEQRLKANTDKIDKWGSESNCENVRQYFKIAQNGDTNCQFKTSDGVWWSFGPDKNGNINGKLSKAIVAFKKADLTKAKAVDEKTYDAFYFMTQFDNNKKARIIDVAYANNIGASTNILNNAKVMAFINKKNIFDYFDYCEDDYKSCILKICSVVNGKTSCRTNYYNNQGKIVGIRNSCDLNALNCGNSSYIPERVPELDSSEGVATKGGSCDTQGDNCKEYLAYKCYPNDSTNYRTGCTDYNDVVSYIGTMKDIDGNELTLNHVDTRYSSCNISVQSGDECLKNGGSKSFIAFYYNNATGQRYEVIYNEKPTTSNANPSRIDEWGYPDLNNKNTSTVVLRQYSNCNNGAIISGCTTCKPGFAECRAK